MAEPESAHHDPAHEQDRDGKSSPANETFADESGRAYRDDEVSIERIEKVYKYVFYHPIMELPFSPPVHDTYMDCRKIDRRIIPGKFTLTLTYKYVIFFGAPLTCK
jgi:hypothetical protein